MYYNFIKGKHSHDSSKIIFSKYDGSVKFITNKENNFCLQPRIDCLSSLHMDNVKLKRKYDEFVLNNYVMNFVETKHSKRLRILFYPHAFEKRVLDLILGKVKLKIKDTIQDYDKLYLLLETEEEGIFYSLYVNLRAIHNGEGNGLSMSFDKMCKYGLQHETPGYTLNKLSIPDVSKGVKLIRHENETYVATGYGFFDFANGYEIMSRGHLDEKLCCIKKIGSKIILVRHGEYKGRKYVKILSKSFILDRTTTIQTFPVYSSFENIQANIDRYSLFILDGRNTIHVDTTFLLHKTGVFKQMFKANILLRKAVNYVVSKLRKDS